MKLNPETMAVASSRHPWRTLAAWVVLIAAMAAVSARLLTGVMTDDVAFTNEPESVKAQHVLDERFAAQQAEDTEYLVIGSETQRVGDPAYPDFVSALQARVQRLGADVLAGPAPTYVQARRQASMLFTPDQHGVLVLVQLNGDVGRALARIQGVLHGAAPLGYEARFLTPEELSAMFGDAPSAAADPPEAVVLVSSAGATAREPVFGDAVKQVKVVVGRAAGPALAGPPMSGLDAMAQANSLVSTDERTTLIPVALKDLSEANVERLRAIADRASNGTFTVQVAGGGALYADMMTLVEQDMRSSESIGLGIALIVLIVVFAAILAAVLPIVMGLFAIAVSLGLVALIGQVFRFNLFVENMVTMIGLAVGIDYSLFIVSRYREERKKGFDKLESIRRSGATANRAVFFSGTTVVLALCGMLIIPVSIFRSLAAGAILVTVAAIGASMTLLPAILALLGDRINWPRLARRARVESSHDPAGGFWDRVSRGVMARPVVFLVASVTLLGGLGAFYFQLHRGTSQSVSALPDEFESRQAFLTLVNEFDLGGVTDPVRIVVTGDVGSPSGQRALGRLREAVANDPAFSSETSVEPAADGSAYEVSAYFRGDPYTDAGFQAIRDLRSRVIPQAVGASALDVFVGGNTAFFTDFLKIADDYQWIVLVFVLTLSFVLLTIVFRSIVVPLKAILMNLLSVAAAYGAVTLVFQKGVGIGIFNAIGFQFKRVEAIEAWLPLFLFSVLFGLSMDYHVFLLTRIREEYDKTGDNAEAVAYGLRTTAGIITGAALIMVAVFTAFSLGRVTQFQQMGFGLAVAVLLDATIVRTLLVPASMRLLGDWNWYLPRWLGWLPQLRVEGGEEPAVAVEAPLAPERVRPS